MPPVEGGVGYPITYQYDITLIVLVNDGDAGAEAAEDGQGGDRVPAEVNGLEPGKGEHDRQRAGSGYPLSRYVCSPLHGVVNVSVIARGVLLAGGVLLTVSCWGGGAVSRGARILLIAGAVGSVMVGLVPEDVNLDLHVLGAGAPVDPAVRH